MTNPHFSQGREKCGLILIKRELTGTEANTKTGLYNNDDQN